MTVDDREPQSVVEAFRTHPDVADVTVRRLDAGDVVAAGVGFERKTVADYLGSAMGRSGSDLADQVRRMTETYDQSYVLVEGTLADLEAFWPDVPATSVRGSLASITARYGVAVIPCGDPERLVDVAVRIARKHVEEPSPQPLGDSAVPARDVPTAKKMYGCIDGIGPGTAEALYEQFPTVESLVAAAEADILAIEGVGPVRAEAIIAALRGEE